nr:AAA family ATPase [Parahaliea mediterranea]
MLVGLPGTAKSWFSELLSAAISGDSTLVVQGGAIQGVDQMLYTWNQALLERDGPTPEALVPGPLLRGMQAGSMVRFEELARCAPAVQDALLSVLSERMVTVPELPGEAGRIYAREGFNLIGTSNTQDKGVDSMSSALKRRLNFETVLPIASIDDELAVVVRETAKLLRGSGVEAEVDEDILRALVTIFHELRNGQSIDGRSTDRLASAVLSTAEAVTVAHAMGIYAYYYREGRMLAEDFTRLLVGAAVKDNRTDLKRMNHYFETEVSLKDGPVWRDIYQSWKLQVKC